MSRKIWVYASHSDGKLDAVSLELLGKARGLAAAGDLSVEAVILGKGVGAMPEELLGYGPSTVLVVEDDRLARFSSAFYAHALAELAKKHKPDILLMGCGKETTSLAARVAARLETGLSAHCVDLKLDGELLVQTVPGFGGDILANIVCPQMRPQMATVAAGVFDPQPGRTPGAKVVRENVPFPAGLRSGRKVDSQTASANGAQTLSSARVVVAGGFGVGSKEGWSLVEALAEALGGVVGATRPPIDEGWAPADRMIGASGKSVKPELYIGLGVSGMMHHTCGIGGSKTIVAVNSDPQAAIFSMADYGIVGNVRDVVPAILSTLRASGNKEEPADMGFTRSPEAFKESLKSMRPNMYKFGKLIEDVVEDPKTRRSIEGHSQIYEAARDPEHRDLLTTVSHLTAKRISRYLSILQSPEDMIANCRMKRLMFNLTGTCTGGRCAGWTAMNAMWATTWDIDHDRGTDYHERLKKWLLSAQERDISVAGALTDPKGHRKLSPSRQKDPDMFLRIVKKTPEGVVVRGAKVMICGIAAANEIFVMPGTRLKASDADYAVSFAVPKDAKGITIIETRHPSDDRESEPGFDNPVTRGGITQAYIVFEDVFIPNERVFMCREYRYAQEAVSRFTLPYRSAIGGCVAGQGDVMVGASILIARANGLNENVFRDKLIRMMLNNETTFAGGVAASVLGTKHPSGAWLPDPVLAHANKVHVATLPYETKRLAQEIAGGLAETGCIPSYKDFVDSRYGHLLRKYLKAHSPAEVRVRIARLIEWLTLGAGVPGCMHGGGSPDGARMVVWAESKRDAMVDMAKRLGGVSDITLK
ncbi:MAG: 4-hydroxyphenylacetate 3-hydroxylase N-terminal domain-containing protein [Elusimicrobiota bacterium]